jgi:hypothetical protein
MNKPIQQLVNKANASKSTGPKTRAGKQRSSQNAFKHGLTGNRMILQEHEHEAYNRLTDELNRQLKPGSELERQLVQKIIDAHTRLNRIAALDGNILNFGLIQMETAAAHDDALETIAAQCRSWIENADSFEKLGRYEARISRQLLQYTQEFERLRAIRRCIESSSAPVEDDETTETEAVTNESGSFRNTPHQVPPKRPIAA